MTTETEAKIREAAARGVALLDSRYPGWRSHIDWQRLDMNDVFCCILGNLFRDTFARGGMSPFTFAAKTMKIGDSKDWMVDWNAARYYGFATSTMCYSALCREWLRHMATPASAELHVA